MTKHQLIIVVGSVFAAQHTIQRPYEDVLKTFDRAINAAKKYIEYCETKHELLPE